MGIVLFVKIIAPMIQTVGRLNAVKAIAAGGRSDNAVQKRNRSTIITLAKRTVNDEGFTNILLLSMLM